MLITAPEYLLLLGLSVLNVGAAFILASVRARAKDEVRPTAPPETSVLDMAPGAASEQRA